jgi:hypothetical protein
MARSISGKPINQILAAGVNQWFGHHGFARSGRSFFRTSEQVIHTASIQASKINMPGDVCFAVNLGVEWPYWHRIWTGSLPRPNPALAPTFVQSRLNPTASGRDYWWTVDSNDDPEDIAHEIVSALAAQAEEFWSRHGDLDNVLRQFDAGHRVTTGAPAGLIHAALLVNAGRTVEARDAVRKANKRAPASFDVRTVAKRMGLDLRE